MFALPHRSRSLAPTGLEPVKKRRRAKKNLRRRSNRKKDPPSTLLHILTLPAEIRLRIYEFCFPPQNSQVQLIPFYVNDSQCHLNLPTNIYLVCRQIYHELHPLHIKLRSLDFTFIIRSEFVIGLPPTYYVGNIANNDHGADDDADLTHFKKIIRHAVRVKIICSGVDILTLGIPLTRSILPSQIGLPRSALRILEIEIRPFCFIPPEWNCVDVIRMPWLARTMVDQIVGPLLGPFLQSSDNLQIMMHENDGWDEGFERAIREQIRPYIPTRTIVGYINGFRGDYLAALLDMFT